MRFAFILFTFGPVSSQVLMDFELRRCDGVSPRFDLLVSQFFLSACPSDRHNYVPLLSRSSL